MKATILSTQVIDSETVYHSVLVEGDQEKKGIAYIHINDSKVALLLSLKDVLSGVSEKADFTVREWEDDESAINNVLRYIENRVVFGKLGLVTTYPSEEEISEFTDDQTCQLFFGEVVSLLAQCTNGIGQINETRLKRKAANFMLTNNLYENYKGTHVTQFMGHVIRLALKE